MVAPFRSGQALGWIPNTASGSATTQINAAASWYALAFVADSARTLSAVRTYVSAIAGSPGSNITADLYDSTGASGVPGSSIETGKTPTASLNGGAGWYDWTGFTTSLTANQTYWIVWKNANTGTEATNNCTFRNIAVLFNPWLGGNILARESWGSASSTNSGSTWSNNAIRTALRLSYVDGTYDGVTASNTATAAVGDGVYSTRESGVKFTTPINAVLRASGLAFYMAFKSGTPTGNIRFGLWTGAASPVNLAYTNTVPGTSGGVAQWLWAYFPAIQTLSPGASYRVTLGETTQSDASGNRWNLQDVTWDTDANSVILLPWNGTCTKTYFDGSSWTDSALGTSIFGHALLLDTAQEFNPGYRTSLLQQSIGTY